MSKIYLNCFEFGEWLTKRQFFSFVLKSMHAFIFVCIKGNSFIRNVGFVIACDTPEREVNW